MTATEDQRQETEERRPETGDGGPATTFAVATIRDLGPWREFLAGEVLLAAHKRSGCCEDVLATLAEIERRHRCQPKECELRIITGGREVSSDVFSSVLAALVTDTGVDSAGRKVLMLWFGWARPGVGGPALRWGAAQLKELARERGCQVIEAWSGRDEAAYGRWIERNLGAKPVNVRMYRLVLPD